MGDIYRARIWDQIFHPEVVKQNMARATAEYLHPYEQIMARQYLEQNPQADFGGVPGYDQIQREFNAKVEQTGGPLYNARKDKDGKTTGYSPKSKEEQLKQRSGPDIVLGAQGFRGNTPSTKDHIFQKLQRKRELGIPLSNVETKFEMKYLGVDENKKKPKEMTPQDRKRIRDLAKEYAINDFRKEYGDTDASGYEPSEDAISQKMGQAQKFYYPNMEVSQPEQVEITIPAHYKNASQALKYLIDEVGMPEDEAKSWLRARVKGKQ